VYTIGDLNENLNLDNEANTKILESQKEREGQNIVKQLEQQGQCHLMISLNKYSHNDVKL
jgi:hypothetical protein